MPKNSKPVSKNTGVIGKSEPHSAELEQAMLGSALIDSEVAIKMCGRLGDDDFYQESHKLIFDAVRHLINSKKSLDNIMLFNLLEERGHAVTIGGLHYLHTLSNIVPSSAHHEEYIAQIKEKSNLRKLISASSKTIERSYNNEDFDTVITDAEMSLYEIKRGEESRDIRRVDSIMPDVIREISERADPLRRKGIRSGFIGLDVVTNGFQPSDLILLAARPSAGKSLIGMNFLTNIACYGQKYENRKSGRYCAAFFSLEMSKEQIVTRMLASVGNVSMAHIANGSMSPEENERLLKASHILNLSNIYIDDSGAITPSEIFRKCLRLKRERGLDIVVIDYLQLIQGRQSDNRVQVISEITRYLKLAAKELNIPVILLSQLSRAVEKRDDKMPQLSDLRESGAIEQDADIVIFIHDPNYEKKRNMGVLSPEEQMQRQLVIAKHRNGRLGNIDLLMDGEHARFVDAGSKYITRADSLAKHDKESVMAAQGYVSEPEPSVDLGTLPEGFTDSAAAALDKDAYDASGANDYDFYEDPKDNGQE